MVRIDLTGALLLVVLALAASWIAVRLARVPEAKLSLKGVGYLFLGAFVIWIGSVPVPVLQLAGAILRQHRPGIGYPALQPLASA